MLLYIIRHGEPDYEHDCLTETGKKQAEALAARLAVNGLDRIYSSPLGRARMTAEPTAKRLGLPIQIEDWASEAVAAEDFGVCNARGIWQWIFAQNGANFNNERNGELYSDWRKADCLFDLDAEHCYDKVSAASDEFIESLGYKREGHLYKIVKPNDERVALFCHEGFTMTWMPWLLQMPPYLWWSHFAYTHTGITVVRFENFDEGITVPRVLVWSEMSHIFADGKLPMKYQGMLNV